MDVVTISIVSLIVFTILCGIIISLLITRSIHNYYQKNSILTEGELRFYRILSFLVKDSYFIFPQVRLANVVKIPKERFFWESFNPLGSKCVDFVLCDKKTGETLLVIELDDKTHTLPHRRRRDKFVDTVLKKAGIPILHQPYLGNYKNEDLIKKINKCVGKTLM